MYEISETSKWRTLTAPFCRGIGIDVGAAGDPVVPNAICCDLPGGGYCPPFGPVPTHLPVDGRQLWKIFIAGSLDFVYSSHLLEDFHSSEWPQIIQRWCWLIKRAGYLVLVVPEAKLWRRAVERGQPPNLNHKHEFEENELTEFFEKSMPEWKVIFETIPDPEDYSIVFTAQRRLQIDEPQP